MSTNINAENIVTGNYESNSMQQRLTFREKAGYGFGDFASSIFWKLFSVYLLFYYTDVVGLPAAAVGTMFLITRIWDTLFDPAIGILADRTSTRWGKFRPYLLFMSIPFAIIGVLTFTAPAFTAAGNLVYAYITYTLMMMIYSAINVPYASLMGVMTPDIKERTALSSYRFVFAFAGSILVLATAEPLVDLFMNTGLATDLSKGWQYAVSIFSAVAAICFYITFRWTRERVHPMSHQQPNLKADCNDLWKNRPWFILLGAGVFTLIFNSLRDGSAIFYFKYYFRNQEAFALPLLNITVNYSTLYLVLGQIANIVGVLLVKTVADRIGKKHTFLYAMSLAGSMSIVFFFFNEDQLLLIFIFQFLISVCAGIIFPLLWSMYGDIADYSEWQTGRRATGLVFSSSSMAQKLGWTLGGAITGWMLALNGFEANIEQTETARTGIRMMVSIFPAAGALVSAFIISYYKLTDHFMTGVSADLAERRKEDRRVVRSSLETIL